MFGPGKEQAGYLTAGKGQFPKKCYSRGAHEKWPGVSKEAPLHEHSNFQH